MRELVFRTAIYIAPIILCRMKFCAIGGCVKPPGWGIWPGCITGRPGIGAAIGPPPPGCIGIPGLPCIGPPRIARFAGVVIG